MSISIDGGSNSASAALQSVRAQTATPLAGNTGTSSASSSTITASDFMTLLVTEMKNQDPTQPTDPTQYVQQLVSVNSLEQLVSINQGITGLTPHTMTPPTTPVS